MNSIGKHLPSLILFAALFCAALLLAKPRETRVAQPSALDRAAVSDAHRALTLKEYVGLSHDAISSSDTELIDAEDDDLNPPIALMGAIASVAPHDLASVHIAVPSLSPSLSPHPLRLRC